MEGENERYIFLEVGFYTNLLPKLLQNWANQTRWKTLTLLEHLAEKDLTLMVLQKRRFNSSENNQNWISQNANKNNPESI